MSTTTSLRLLLSLSPSTPPLQPSSSTFSLSFCSTSPSSSSSYSYQQKWFVPKRSSFSSRIGANLRIPDNMDRGRTEIENVSDMFGSDEESGTKIPTQAQSIVEGSSSVMVSEFKPVRDVDYIQELLAIQQQGPRSIGFFGTRNMGFMHQELIEILSYAMVITKNHIYTSGAAGTNAAVIRGALRAERPELLTVILPQSLKKQPPESQELLAKVKNVIEKPHNDHLPLLEASRLCNMDIISKVQQVICFAFHDSKLLMETCQEAKNLRKIVTLFYLD
ncbi:hypothetical protein BVRB_3g059260 isoform B [Beta vulgaris subsp. vulgaris]|uniref:uncharacterized protein LOC104889070 n=1 Tax=Beta vulgaris subsp. vulgaris TaxID=3555 RepID=UPI00053F4843|nr:uncharacterized protein LOC104889070 [Beta vulgaris subsp. vulgaris]KMT15576.1 hypothetical protein BVRB_3g059260 isoform B [Beta vulgaris subsp. vulgaris]